ncbi:glutamate-5-semialdehyde dehydrogenase [Sandaracinus amylolyticus]|uniref:glutamate-5-semialdehyde dehydrogenase n=1 Tax=Sandaracinus amylolyticus TaxID=927083 RepID=UPI001F0298F0|nr:glutamate-5-semialdehyde dehydrogenase [Sandaracinus amylolyticus]UJR80730.1 Gamma-glutamyl phosphate reductase [Sandaracinus amylolyticus]
MDADNGLAAEVRRLAERAKQAGRAIAIASTQRKNATLTRAARLLRESTPALIEANRADVERGQAAGLSAAMLDRLTLDGPRIEKMALACEEVARAADPVGSIDQMVRRPNGLLVGRMKVPLGLVGIVYESRPNVTAEAAALCLKSGNAVLLRGGSEAARSNAAIAQLFARALEEEGLDAAAVTLIPTTDRAALAVMVKLSGVLDLLIPRGGEGLIRYVSENATVPVIQHYKGVCHVYVDGDADLELAEKIALNAKVQRPGVCNAMETLLVDAACAKEFVPRVARAMHAAKVELRGDARARALAPDMKEATEADWDAEYLDLVLAVAVVDGIDGALAHVAKHGSLHTEAIVTRRYDHAQRWIREVDASCVLVNASTRFNDGGELGLGAEMGISTTKLHAYGPMGLEELCTRKWIAYGEGQVRG